MQTLTETQPATQRTTKAVRIKSYLAGCLLAVGVSSVSWYAADVFGDPSTFDGHSDRASMVFMAFFFAFLTTLYLAALIALASPSLRRVNVAVWITTIETLVIAWTNSPVRLNSPESAIVSSNYMFWAAIVSWLMVLALRRELRRPEEEKEVVR